MNLINRYSFTCSPETVDLQRMSLENPGSFLAIDDTAEMTLLFLPREFLASFKPGDCVKLTAPGLRGITVHEELGQPPANYFVRRRGLCGWAIRQNYSLKNEGSFHRCIAFPTDAKTEVFKDIANMEAFAKAKVSVAVSVYK